MTEWPGRGFITMDMTDAALVQCVLKGDVTAYGILVDRHYERCSRYARHMLGNREDAEEVVQDAFVRAFRSLSRYEDRERFGAWLLRILVNRCRTAGARRQRRERTFVREEHALAAAAEEHPAERTAWREEIDRALTRLEPEQREAFLLKHVEELSYEEMSKLTGVGISALKMRVKRACDRLRELLEEVQSV
ncbi:MAG TPA: RNA polymerase sigma factor [Gemmatimonadaceae bacterium]|nr:RNA polymerase sigma factor [Gemmatimonadaceae bacterium]